MRTSKCFQAALLVLCLISVSCDSDDVGCDRYYLTEAVNPESADKFFYNEHNLIDVMENHFPGFPPRRDQYFYNSKLQLTQVDIGDLYRTKYIYGNDDRLKRTEFYSAQTGNLSSAYEFIYGSDGRLAKRELYTGDGVLSNYFTFEYPSVDVMKVQFFIETEENTFELDQQFSYKMDDRPRPFPDEYYTYYSAWGHIVVDHNVMSLEVVQGGSTTTVNYSYEFNEAGYPVSTTPSGVTYTYSCEPVRE